MYEFGDGVQKDTQKAKELYKKSYEMGLKLG
jgi:TPR repeat protein